MFIDTHTHLNSEQFDADRNDVIQRAIRDGVSRFYIPNVDLASIAGMHALENAFPNHCFGMMGLHPCSVGTDWEAVLATMKEYLVQRTYVAIGEIGIDLYWDKTTLPEQQAAFRTQVQWAKAMNLPIVIHARDSFQEIYEILDEENDATLRGIFHCFTGNVEDVKKIDAYGGFLFGIGGVVTYKTSDLPTVIPAIPSDKLVLETDAPYLPPVPYRGKRNESSYLVHTAEKVATILDLPLTELAALTTKNALRLFQPEK
jgi:TatD DNase family protein